MDAEVRRRVIQDAVERDGFVRLADLSEELGVAPVTVHRDLDLLASVGAIERIRGGARSTSGRRHDIRTDFNLRRTQASIEKAAIAQRAVAEIHDGATVFLDSSTTSLALAMELERVELSGLTVVTNSPAIAFQLHAPYLQVISTPGDVNQSLRAITGTWTLEFLSELSFSLAFVSAAGIDLRGGLMTTQRDLAEITRKAIAQSDRAIAIVDSSKFDSSALISAAPLKSVDLVITDDGIEVDIFEKYQAAGVSVAIAPLES
jgi:DeoR family fructose operon transcriptional repressor